MIKYELDIQLCHLDDILRQRIRVFTGNWKRISVTVIIKYSISEFECESVIFGWRERVEREWREGVEREWERGSRESEVRMEKRISICV